MQAAGQAARARLSTGRRKKLAWLCVAVGFLIFAHYVREYRAVQTYIGTGVRARAEVVGVRRRPADVRSYSVVTFRFTGPGGAGLTARRQVSSSRYAPGQRVDILYLPGAPETVMLAAEIDSPQRTLMRAFMFGVAVVFLLGGILALARIARRAGGRG